MAFQSSMRHLTNRTWPLESIGVSIGDSIGGAYVNIGDSIGGAYVKIGDSIGSSYVKVLGHLNTPFLGQNGPFPPLYIYHQHGI